MAEDPNAAVVSAAQTAASDVGTAVSTAASSVATAVQADAERLAVKDEAKAESWAHREWDMLKAKMHAVLVEMEAYVKAKL
jgi:hypothetical protein